MYRRSNNTGATAGSAFGSSRISSMENAQFRRMTTSAFQSGRTITDSNSTVRSLGVLSNFALSFINRPTHTKDPRPLNSREYQAEMITKLLEFLSSNGILNMTEKQMRQLSRQDFVNIFTNLYGFLDENYTYNKARPLEVEIPYLYKMIGYPIPLNKSCIQAVGTPHAWTSIIGALCWLVDAVQFGMNFDVMHLTLRRSDDDSIASGEESVRSLVQQYYSDCFINFLDGNDSFECFDQYLADRIESGDNGNEHQLDQLRSERERLSNELQNLHDTEEALEKLQSENKKFETDIGSMESYLIGMNTYEQERLHCQRQYQSRLKTIRNEMASVKEELKKKEAIIAQQELKPADLQRMASQREQCKTFLAMNRVEKQHLEGDLSESQKAASDFKENVDRLAFTYMRKAQQLSLSKPAFSDLTHELQPFSSSFIETCRHNVLPLLNNVRNTLVEEHHEKKSKLKYVMDDVAQLRIREKEFSEACNLNESNMRRCDDDIKMRQADSDVQLQRARKHLADLKSQYDMGNRRKNGSCAEKEASLNQLSKMIAEKQSLLSVESKRWEEVIKWAVEKFKQHKEIVAAEPQKLNDQINTVREILTERQQSAIDE